LSFAKEQNVESLNLEELYNKAKLGVSDVDDSIIINKINPQAKLINKTNGSIKKIDVIHTTQKLNSSTT
jgi:hypothetical protein